MSCKSQNNTKDFFIERGIFDKFYNILNLGKFRNENSKWTDFAKSEYNVDEGLIYKEEENGKKATPNIKAFSKIDGIRDYRESVKNKAFEEQLSENVEDKLQEDQSLGITETGDSDVELYNKAMELDEEIIKERLKECA